jgi:hypothetical protein
MFEIFEMFYFILQMSLFKFDFEVEKEELRQAYFGIIKRLALKGSRKALFRLGKYFQKNNINGLEIDHEMALLCFSLSANKGCKKSIESLNDYLNPSKNFCRYLLFDQVIEYSAIALGYLKEIKKENPWYEISRLYLSEYYKKENEKIRLQQISDKIELEKKQKKRCPNCNTMQDAVHYFECYLA